MAMMNWVATAKEVSWVLRDPDTRQGEHGRSTGASESGDVVKLRVFNDPASSHAMDHPLHLHGQRFLVVSRDGVRTTNLVWKDTAIIPAGETVDLLVDMANPGRWMIHCHIAEHLGAGMMGVFSVDPGEHRQDNGNCRTGQQQRQLQDRTTDCNSRTGWPGLAGLKKMTRLGVRERVAGA